VRNFIHATVLVLFLAALSSPLAAQNNPVPFINDSLLPSVAAPGGPAFTLTVTGAGFVSGAAVLWNGSPRVTTFLSSSKLTAAISASDIATAGQFAVTVSNPNPGGGISNAVPFEVATSTTSLAFTRADSKGDFGFGPMITQPNGMAVGYTLPNGAPLLAIANAQCTPAANCLVERATVSLLGPGTTSYIYTGRSPRSVVFGDFNGDGLLDLLTLGGGPAGGPYISISLGGGSGLTTAPFDLHKDYQLPSGVLTSFSPVVGDFNRDGHLDLIVASSSQFFFVPGIGDGSFGPATSFGTGPSSVSVQMVAGDFNGDGFLDFVSTNEMGNVVSIYLGNGDGTFQTHVDYGTGSFPEAIVAGDFNGDGNLDLAVLNALDHSVSILLGKGDGTFQLKGTFPAGSSVADLTTGDYNGDGHLDLAVSDSQCTNTGCPADGSVNVLIGNGDGTFLSHLDFGAGADPRSIVSGDFARLAGSGPSTGRSGFAVVNYQDNTVSLYTPSSGGGNPNPLPTISSISPQFVIQGSAQFTLTVNGTNFASSSTVSFGGQTVQTTFVSTTQLTALIPASALTTVGPLEVNVFTPSPGGGNSTMATFNVYLPPPTISSITPSSVVVGSPGFTLTINGTNFVSGAVVDFNGVARTTTFVNSGQLTAVVASSDVANQGTINIDVTIGFGVNNSGGGTSGTATLTVVPTNSQPTIGSLIPASTTAGGPSFTLTITGSGFSASSVVTFGGMKVTSAYQSPGELQATIPASAIAKGGTALVTVANPGGNPSVVVSFAINNPVAVAISLSPSSVVLGSAALTLTVTGSNFVQGAVVQVNGSARPTSFVSGTSVTANLPASDFAQAAALTISVINPPPGGGTGSGIGLTVSTADYSVSPTIPSTTVSAGQPASYSLNLVPSTSNGKTSGNVTFSTGLLPAGATPTFIPSSVPAGSTSTAVMLSIKTTQHISSFLVKFPPENRPSDRLWHMIFTLIGLMVSVIWTVMGKTRRLVPQFLLVALLILAAGLVACGGSGSSNSGPQLNPGTGTPAGTYTITVYASEGGVTDATNVTLIVQ
jgi:hypothetical protein